MDPLAAARAEMPQRSALERLSYFGDLADQAEARQAEEQRAERAAQREAALMAAGAAERAQVFTRGYSDAELARHQGEQEARRQERVAELEAELDRIDPKRARVRQAETQRAMAAYEAEQTLRRARETAADPFMRRQREAFHEREIARKSAGRQAEMARHAGALGEIVR